MTRLPEDPAAVVDAIASLAKIRKLDRLVWLLDLAEADYEYQGEDWGISYQRLVLSVPFEVYAEASASIDKLERELDDLASIATRACNEEKVRSVVIANNFDAPKDWRSGAQPVVVTLGEAEQIWKPGHFRLFLSHRDTVKVEAGILRKHFAKRGIDLFVAHEDIEPSREWAKTIKIALSSSHAILALVTHDFHGSAWCLQEVGWGLGRGVLVQSVKLPDAPVGLYGDIQAVAGSLEKPVELREKVCTILTKNSKTAKQMHEPLVRSIETAKSEAAVLTAISDLESAQSLSLDHAQRIHQAVGSNPACSGAATAQRLAKLAGKFMVLPAEQKATTAEIDLDDYDPFADE